MRGEGLEHRTHDLLQRRALPGRPGEKIVGARQRHDPLAEGASEFLRIGLAALGVLGQRLDDGERVLDPVVELVEQQALALFGGLEVGDVDQHADHAQRLAGSVAIDLAAIHHPAHLAVGPADAVGELVLLLGGEDLPLAPGDLPAVVGMHEVERRIEIAVLPGPTPRMRRIWGERCTRSRTASYWWAPNCATSAAVPSSCSL